MIDRRISIPALLAQRAEEDPGRPFITEIGGRAVTYGEFLNEARRWAAALSALGVERGDTVVTMLTPSIDAFACWIGISWLGAIDTPVNTDHRGRMLTYVLNTSRARTAVIASRFADRFADVAGDVSGLRDVVAIGDAVSLPWTTHDRASMLSGAPAQGLPAPEPWDIACMVYTSGTTGPSKGVLVPWAQQLENTIGVIPAEDVSDDDVYYSAFPMFHGSGRIPLCLMTLANGRFVLRESFSGSEFWTDIREHGCTTTGFVGAMPVFLWSQPPSSDDADNPLRRAIMLPVMPFYREFEQRFDVRLRTCYAMSEVSPPFGTGWDITNPKTCGTVRPGFEVRIVDDHDFEVPPGEVGELIVRTHEPWLLCAGYFDMPEATAAAWRNGWFHTGDAFRRDDDGNYFFVDRFKDAIRRRGENISSFEVEAHVNSHPDVAESAAVAVPSEWGEDEVKVVVVRKPGSSLQPEELLSYVIGIMPRFMVPRYIEFTDALPKTEATMRVRKNVLREQGLTDGTWDREAAGIEVPR